MGHTLRQRLEAKVNKAKERHEHNEDKGKIKTIFKEGLLYSSSETTDVFRLHVSEDRNRSIWYIFENLRNGEHITVKPVSFTILSKMFPLAIQLSDEVTNISTDKKCTVKQIIFDKQYGYEVVLQPSENLEEVWGAVSLKTLLNENVWAIH